MTLEEYQADLRRAYIGGGLGAVVSGLVWFAAALVQTLYGVSLGYTVLFFGGFLIFPISLLLEKVFFKRAPLQPGNPGGALVMETLPAMIGVLVIGFLLIEIKPDWVFPLAAIAVGAHYFPFKTAYGDRTYWVLGAVMMAIGFASLMMGWLGSGAVAFGIAMTEVVFGIWLILRNRTL